MSPSHYVTKSLEWQDLGVLRYRDAWRLQDELRERRVAGEIGDRFLLVEHPPVFTLGKRDCSDDFLSSPEAISADGIEMVRCNRGGRVTYHGPGQLVGYFICGLSSLELGVRDFMKEIEIVCLRVLSDFNIDANTDDENPGIWVGHDKLVAIGLNVSRGVTQHGFAVNVDCDLGAYRHIVACGIKGRGVTAISRVLGHSPGMPEVKRSVISHIGKVFSRRMVELI